MDSKNLKESLSTRAGTEPVLSVVTPVFNEAEILARFYSELSSQLNTLDVSFEIVFVDDGSTDASKEILDGFAQRDPKVRVLHLARNFGQQMATTAGLQHSRGQAVVILDADLQDPPELIGEMLAKWQQGYKVVYGVRKKREGETLFKKVSSFLFYRLMSSISDVPVPRDTGDFRLMDRRVVDVYKLLHEDPRFFRGLISWIGFKQYGLRFVRKARAGGTSKWRFAGLMSLAFDTITGFSSAPARIITSFALVTMFGGFFVSASALVLWAIGYFNLSGLQWALLGFFNVWSAQFLCMAVLGEYIVRTHRNTQHRPLYVVESVVEGKEQYEAKAV